MLRIDELVVTYGAVRALDGVSLCVPRGEVTAVLGANGAGKSSLMRALAGLVPAQSGSIGLDDRSLANLGPEDIVRAGVALVPEGRATIPELTVEENLKLGGLWRTRDERAQSMAGVFDLFPILAQRRRMRAHSLSGGERQQLAVGRALMCGPTCLLLDEPSLGLAPLIVTQILELIQRLAVESDLAVLLVEQNAATALRVASTAVVLNLGRVVQSGPAAQIAANEELRNAYLGMSRLA